MKKYVMPIVAIVLIVAALVLPSDSLTPVVSAGAGNGQNAEITSLKELGEVIDFIAGIDSDSETSMLDDGSTVLTSSFDSDDEDEDEDESKKNPHSSVTMIEDTVIVINNKSEKSKIKRSLTMYITQDATYYISKGSSSDEDTTTAMFDLEMYVSEDVTLVKFEKYSLTYSNSSGEKKNENISTEYVGKWLKIPAEGSAMIFSMIDEINRDTLGNIGDLIKQGKDAGFKEKNDVYSLEQSNLEEDDTLITIDLSDNETPSIEWLIDAEYTTVDYETFSYDMIDTITFCNIDNTVIEINDDNVIEFDDLEEFTDECFGG